MSTPLTSLFRKSLIALAVLAPTFYGAAQAQSFYITVPLDRALDVTLSLAQREMPRGFTGYDYGRVDFKPLLKASDAAFHTSKVTWSAANMPAGLTLSADGVLTGIPTQAFSGNIQVRAGYRTLEGVQEYQVIVQPLSVEFSDAELPVATYGRAYAANLNDYLIVSTDTARTWEGTTTGDLQVAANGQVSGTQASTLRGNSLSINASVEVGPVSKSKAWVVPVIADVKNYGSYRGWSDGSYASSCAVYKSGAGVFKYQGDTGDGVYRLNINGTEIDAYCDMTVNGGGWMLAYSQKGAHTPFAARNSSLVTPANSGSHQRMDLMFSTATEFRWTDTNMQRMLQGKTHMPTWYTKFTTQGCDTAGNTIQVQFENGWLNTATTSRSVESCKLYPFGMRNNMNYAPFRDIAGYNNNTTHMCWFDDNVKDRPFSHSHDSYSTNSYCTQFNYTFPATATRGGTMDYMVWIR